MLSRRTGPQLGHGPPGAQSPYAFRRANLHVRLKPLPANFAGDLTNQPSMATNMLYKFKSKAAGDLILLQENGERILQIIGKDAGPKGIILPEQMPGAIEALEKAVAQAENPPATERPGDTEAGKQVPAADRVTLRQRAAPFIDMLKRCHHAGKEIVWGV